MSLALNYALLPTVHLHRGRIAFLCNQLCFFVASLRNFGERTANLFRRKKNTAEQNVQDLANETEEAAVSLKNDLQNDTNEVAENTGYYLLSSSKQNKKKTCLHHLSIN